MKMLFKYASVLTVLSVMFFILAPRAEAVSASNWQAGRIIDDFVQFNSQTMGAGDIQAFLNAKVPSCDTYGTKPSGRSGYPTRADWGRANGYAPPYICLKDYSQSIPSKSADSYCSGSISAGTKSAAQIINDVSKACSINPQSLIVLLQKEQSLITDEWPWSIQYRSATGYGCPDTAPCDAEYYGFFNQVYNAARQFQRYAKLPNNYNYAVGRTSFVGYNPNAGCSGTNVYMRNAATAGLYNYTPYQPNQAALNNLYGTGDGCSAYGNRNFWRMFNDWFGSTIGDLVSNGTGGVYKIEDGVKRAFPNEISFLSYGYKWSNVTFFSSTQLAQIPDGAAMPYNVNFRNGILVTSASNGMYVVANGTKRPFPNEGVYLSYGYGWSDPLVISNLELSLIPEGAAMPFNANHWNGHLVTSASNGMYVVANGTKRPFPNELTYLSYGYGWSDALSITNAELSQIPDGAAMPYNVNFRNGRLIKSSNGGVYLVENGQKRPFPSEDIFYSYSYKWADVLTISPTEMSQIPDGAAMPPKS